MIGVGGRDPAVLREVDAELDRHARNLTCVGLDGCGLDPPVAGWPRLWASLLDPEGNEFDVGAGLG